MNPSWQEHTRFQRAAVCSGTNVLLYTLGRMLMRHTKAQVLGGQAVSQLPPKTEETVAGSLLSLESYAPLSTMFPLCRRLDVLAASKLQLDRACTMPAGMFAVAISGVVRRQSDDALQ